MLTKEMKARIADYFEAADLVDFLQIKVEDIIEAFEEDIEENLDDIEDMIGIRHGNEDLPS
jgi:hypothetical protein